MAALTATRGADDGIDAAATGAAVIDGAVIVGAVIGGAAIVGVAIRATCVTPASGGGG